MRMSIDEAIEIINHYLDYPKEEVRKALLVAIDTMERYQKIEQIVNNYISIGKPYTSVIDVDIRKVLEDGLNEKTSEFAISSLKTDEAYQLEYEKTTSKFPAIEGALAEMLVDGKWIKGKIIKGYRFDDGIVTIEAEDGQKYWCGQSRTDCYREIKGNKNE